MGEDVYEGLFLNGKMNRNGSKKWFNGDFYDGEWQDGLMHGEGLFISNDGLVY